MVRGSEGPGGLFVRAIETSAWQFANANLRGGPTTGGRPTLSVEDAAAYLTRAGLSWSTLGQNAVVTFAFRATSGPLPLDVAGFTQFTTVQIQATLLALQAWSDVAGITFVRQDDGAGYSDNATILFGNYTSGAAGAAAFAALPGSTASNDISGDVWVNQSLNYNAAPALGGYGQFALVHEIGHAIGLLHPGDYDALPDVPLSYNTHAGYEEDSGQYTVMSYFSETSTGAYYGPGRYASAPLLDDIAAAQRLYGANLQTRTGDTVYGFNSTAERPWFVAVDGGPVPVFAIWDAGGTDTLDFSGYAVNQTIDLRQGCFSSIGGLAGNVSIAVGAVIENAIGGSGDDTFFGGSNDNRFTPGGGHNTVNGGLGADTVVFSGPLASYTISWSGQQGFVSGPEGTCRVENVEFLAFSDGIIAAAPTGGLRLQGDITDEFMDGTEHSDSMSGSDGDDVVLGQGGHDQLDGGRGNDRVDGGEGNDIIYADAGDDSLVGGDGVDVLDLGLALGGVVLDLGLGELSGGGLGTDLVSGFERVVGTRFDDVIIGDASDNFIQAFGGVDLIHGGQGDDELVGTPDSALLGDAGDDTLRGSDATDKLYGGEGDDVIWAGRGADVVDGGVGWDTLRLWESNTDCRLLMISETEFLLKGPDGADRITGIEVITFINGVSIDLARLYSSGAFDRNPDGIDLGSLSKSVSEEPWVLPGVTPPPAPDAFIPTKGAGAPLVLPGEDELAPAPWLNFPIGGGAGFADRMLSLDADGLIDGPGHLGRLTDAAGWPD